jgi:biopolymer transport protein ExbB/biopolymer transport protein TolQ
MQQFTTAELWSHMGVFARAVVYALGLMSVASVVVMVERCFSFARSSRDGRRFARALGERLAGGGVDAAADAAGDRRERAGHLGRVLAAGLGAYREARATAASPEVTVESVARALERHAQREGQRLRGGLNLLATVGSTAPFVGLLGTVVGIINAFQAMARSGSGGLGTVSAGIAEALVTTAFGLLVAIPAVMAYNAMLGWVDARMVDVSESSNELLDAVVRRLDPGAPAAAGRTPGAGPGAPPWA